MNAKPPQSEADFPTWLAERMKERNLSQHALARLLGTTQSTVRAWLNDCTPRHRMMAALHQALDAAPPSAFGTRLRDAMESSGVCAAELGRLVGVSHVAIGNYLKEGGSIPNADTAQRIADALAVELRWLVTGEEPKPDFRTALSESPKPAHLDAAAILLGMTPEHLLRAIRNMPA